MLSDKEKSGEEVCRCVTDIAGGPRDYRGIFSIVVEDALWSGPLVTIKTNFRGSNSEHKFLVDKSFFPKMVEAMQRAADRPSWVNDKSMAQGDMDMLGRPIEQTCGFELEDRRYLKSKPSITDYLIEFIESNYVRRDINLLGTTYVVEKDEETLFCTVGLFKKDIRMIHVMRTHSEVVHHRIMGKDGFPELLTGMITDEGDIDRIGLAFEKATYRGGHPWADWAAEGNES